VERLRLCLSHHWSIVKDICYILALLRVRECLPLIGP
jgi:hypothetical protein